MSYKVLENIKECKFKTDKGVFILVDMVGIVCKFVPWDFVEERFSVTDITEEQPTGIVDAFTGESVSAKHLLTALVKSLGAESYKNPVILKIKWF